MFVLQIQYKQMGLFACFLRTNMFFQALVSGLLFRRILFLTRAVSVDRAAVLNYHTQCSSCLKSECVWWGVT